MRKQKNMALGFSMIEVLIAVLILAVGLLGVAALQMTSVRSGAEGYLRSQATAIAEDFASRIRAGREMVKSEDAPWGSPLWGSDVSEFVDTDNDGVADSTEVTGASPTGAMQAYLDQFVDIDGLDCAAAVNLCRVDNGNAANNCDFASLVAYEIFESCRGAGTLLPEGQIRTKRTGARMTIAVSWRVSEEIDPDDSTASIRNTLCTTEFDNFPETDDCVLMEVIP